LQYRSDGVASDILLRLLGGPARVDAFVRELGIAGIRIADTEKTLGIDVSAQYRNYASPDAMVRLLELLITKSPISAENTRLLMQWLHTKRERREPTMD
jgi:beta-lactamase class A